MIGNCAKNTSCLSHFRVILARMSSPDENQALTLQFVDTNFPEAHFAPAGAVAQSMEALQRLVLLLAMRREGHTPGKRIRPSADLQKRYRLVLGVPEPGSLMLPVRMARAQVLFEPQVPEVLSDLGALLAAGEGDDAEAFRRTVSDETWQRVILDALERLAPHPNFGVELTLAQSGRPICHAARLRNFSERLLRAPSASGRQAIVGTLSEISFEQRRMKVRHRSSKRVLTCYYEDEVEASLLEHPRDDVIIFGIMSLNGAGEVEQINQVDHIEPVDLSPVTVSELLHGNEWIKARQVLNAVVEFNEDEILYEASIEELGLATFAETRELLESAISDELSMLWRRYALADDDALTKKAQALKRRMLASFGGPDATESA